MIEVHNVSYRANGRLLLNSIHFRARPGEVCAVVGANGAGKSTFLKLLSRELRPHSGTIEMNGKSLNSYNHLEMARIRAVLAQHNSVSLPFKVNEIVMMGRYPFTGHRSLSQDKDIVEKCLSYLDVGHLADRLYPTLSGGEQQRVQLAKTLAQVWEVPNAYLFLDEPTTGLDLKHQYQLIATANQLAQQGYGIVAIIHDLNMALNYTDRVLLLTKGAVHSFGKPGDVLTSAHIRESFGVAVDVTHPADIPAPVIIPRPDHPSVFV